LAADALLLGPAALGGAGLRLRRVGGLRAMTAVAGAAASGLACRRLPRTPFGLAILRIGAVLGVVAGVVVLRRATAAGLLVLGHPAPPRGGSAGLERVRAARRVSRPHQRTRGS